MGVPALRRAAAPPRADRRRRASRPVLAALPTLGHVERRALCAASRRRVREARKRLKAEKAGAAPRRRGGGDDERREAARASIPPENRPRRILEDLTAARDRARRGVRAAAQRGARRLLDEPLQRLRATRAWTGSSSPSFERDTIRPRIWGRFEDLLLATAQSPAMLFYLDNARSVADEEHRPARSAAPAASRATAAAARRRRASTRTTPASSWSSTRSASTAATRRRTSPSSPAS